MPGSIGPQRLGELPPVLPILPMKSGVLFPFTFVPLSLSSESSIQLVSEASVGDRLVGVFALKNPELPASPDNLYELGTLAFIQRMLRKDTGDVQVLLQGQTRLQRGEIVSSKPYLRAKISRAAETPLEKEAILSEALLTNLTELYTKYIGLSSQLPEDLGVQITRLSDPKQLVYLIGATLSLEPAEAQSILELDTIKDKVQRVSELLSHQIEVLELGRKIRSQANSEMERMQREYILREQLKAIQNELGEGDTQRRRLEEFRSKIEESKMPEEAEKEAQRELDRLQSLQPGSPEYPMIEGYLDWITSLPWSNVSQDMLEIKRAQEILDEDHYDLKDIKERILEYLSVRKLKAERGKPQAEDDKPPTKLRPEREGAIICFIGPPGVGKTSLGVSIARALGRKFVRMSLGGIRDEAEIRGHRRTYIGAVPGRIIQSIRRAGTKNPVFMFDEIDKVGSDWRGDPSSALLEVLDPEQNADFRDNYLNVPFDLSQVLFIATANMSDTIPAPLRDRMEIMQLSGYTDHEKLHIAKNYLIPRQLIENGLREGELEFNDEAVLKVIHDYTREAGVRELERQLGTICRKRAVELARGEAQQMQRIEVKDVTQVLGKERYYSEAKERTEVPGVAIGVAVTAVGGEILFVEATKMAGRKSFTLTGQLGAVMKESALTAYSLVKSKAGWLRIEPRNFERSDVHVHVPAGAVPKDGPSAGITMVTALTSLFTSRPVRADVGMTGEITLRGKVLPVGGIKEKAIAGHRAGLKTLIIPKHNEKDLDDLPDTVKDEMSFILVDTIEEVLQHALEEAPRQMEPAVEELRHTHH
ncbi:MAG: endopeptidase La [Deltaproteobacteria bacterium]|nr:endopeptidase La [Deltaproteobacteria bacterium]